MECKYGVISKEDLAKLVKLRVDYIKDTHPGFGMLQVADVTKGTETFIAERANGGIYVGFAGMVGEEVACAGALLVYELPPLSTAYNRKVGTVLNFFTVKGHRNNGYGRGLMEYIKGYASENGFHKLVLVATDDGYGLYSKCGFKDSEMSMEIDV